MSDIALVLDADAMLAYAKHSSLIAEEISKAADDQLEVMLEVLTNHPVTVVGPVDPELCPYLGGWSRTLGRMDLAHAALEAATHKPAKLVTSERELVGQMLHEWPIIDV